MSRVQTGVIALFVSERPRFLQTSPRLDAVYHFFRSGPTIASAIPLIASIHFSGGLGRVTET
jgi:hypothetical protein